MLHQIYSSEKATLSFLKLLKTLKINTLLRNAGIQKSSGISVNSIFEFLLMLVFQGKNLDRHLNSERGLDQPRKDTYYRFLNYSKYAWRKFLNALVYKVITNFDSLTSASRVRVFILDDSVYSRSRSKQVELLARVFDHANSKFVKGFTMLTLGWSDGFSFIPVDFSMLSSAKESNRLKGLDTSIDKRTSGYKRREEALLKKPDVASQMLDNAIANGIAADYVLMDTWFTNEPMIKMLYQRIFMLLVWLRILSNDTVIRIQITRLKNFENNFLLLVIKLY